MSRPVCIVPTVICTCRGDFLNRGAWYDTLLAGAIPVVFDPAYKPTMPFTDILDYDKLMVQIPLDDVIHEGANVIDILHEDFKPEHALERLRYIHEVAHVFQYMLNPVHELIRFDQLGAVAPEDDAFTMTVKSALKNMCQRGMLPAHRCHHHRLHQEASLD